MLKLFWRTPYLNIPMSIQNRPNFLDQFDFDSDSISQNSYLLLFDRWFNLFGFLTRSRRVPTFGVLYSLTWVNVYDLSFITSFSERP